MSPSFPSGFGWPGIFGSSVGLSGLCVVCMSADFVECAEGGKRFQSIAEPEFSSLAK
jgi:hypothetical protein